MAKPSNRHNPVKQYQTGTYAATGTRLTAAQVSNTNTSTTLRLLFSSWLKSPLLISPSDNPT